VTSSQRPRTPAVLDVDDKITHECKDSLLRDDSSGINGFWSYGRGQNSFSQWLHSIVKPIVAIHHGHPHAYKCRITEATWNTRSSPQTLSPDYGMETTSRELSGRKGSASTGTSTHSRESCTSGTSLQTSARKCIDRGSSTTMQTGEGSLMLPHVQRVQAGIVVTIIIH
jgi:hypothetical protein